MERMKGNVATKRLFVAAASNRCLLHDIGPVNASRSIRSLRFISRRSFHPFELQ